MTQDAQEGGQAGGRRWMLIVACAVLVAVVGAGGVHYFNAVASSQPDAASLAGRPAQYIAFEPPFVVNFENAGLMRFLQVSVEAMTRDDVTAQLLKLHDARLRNDLLLLFSNQPHGAIVTREGKQALRAQALQAVADVITDEGGQGALVEQLYFTSFVMQ